jgi:small subunit ribosomal protein S18
MATEEKTNKEETKEVKKSSDSSRPRPTQNRQKRDTRPQNRNFRRYNRRRQRQAVPAYVDWKDVDYLSRFVPERGKIMPRRISGVSAKDQRRIARAIKRARVMALLPYVAD